MPAALTALAEPRRQEIMKLIWREERTAGDIAEHLPVSFAAVSQHLAVLKSAGVVKVRPDGRKRWYQADHAALGPMAQVLEQMWFGVLNNLKTLAEAEARAESKRSQGKVKHAQPKARRSPARKPRRGGGAGG